MRVEATVFLPWVGATIPAAAGFYDGNELHSMCQRNKSYVIGYVAGAYDATEAGTAGLTMYFLEAAKLVPSQDRRRNVEALDNHMKVVQGYCIPEQVKLGQLADVFCLYLDATPADRHRPARVLFNHAMTKAWPCKN